MSTRFRIAALLGLLATLVATFGLLGCAATPRTYPGYSTPQSALETYFASSLRRDYSTTYQSYNQAYRDRVSEQEFVSHRQQASALANYRIGNVSTLGGTATASVTLTFAAAAGQAPRTVVVRENLVDQAGAWKIRVW